MAGDQEEVDEILQKIDEEVKEEEEVAEVLDQDKPAYSIPSTDNGYRKILKEKFGFDDFKEG